MFPNCPRKKLKIIKNIFRPLFCHCLTKLGPPGHQNTYTKRYYLRPLLSYFAEFSATCQQDCRAEAGRFADEF